MKAHIIGESLRCSTQQLAGYYMDRKILRKPSARLYIAIYNTGATDPCSGATGAYGRYLTGAGSY